MKYHQQLKIPDYFRVCAHTREFTLLTKHVLERMQVFDSKFSPILYNTNLLCPHVATVNESTMSLSYTRGMNGLPALIVYRTIGVRNDNRCTPDYKIVSTGSNNANANKAIDMLFTLAGPSNGYSEEFKIAIAIIDYFRSHHARYDLKEPQYSHGAMCTMVRAVDGEFTLMFYPSQLIKY